MVSTKENKPILALTFNRESDSIDTLVEMHGSAQEIFQCLLTSVSLVLLDLTTSKDARVPNLNAANSFMCALIDKLPQEMATQVMQITCDRFGSEGFIDCIGAIALALGKTQAEIEKQFGVKPINVRKN